MSEAHTLTDSQCRAIFAECYELWSECAAGSTGTVRARIGNVDFGRPLEEYSADMICLARRKLTLYELIIFMRAYVWRWNAHRCCVSLNIDRVRFYDLAQGIQTKLGRMFAEHGFRPIEYFRPRRMIPLPVADIGILLDSPLGPHVN